MLITACVENSLRTAGEPEQHLMYSNTNEWIRCAATTCDGTCIAMQTRGLDNSQCDLYSIATAHSAGPE